VPADGSAGVAEWQPTHATSTTSAAAIVARRMNSRIMWTIQCQSSSFLEHRQTTDDTKHTDFHGSDRKSEKICVICNETALDSALARCRRAKAVW
jgi:hypothetical protein